MGLLCDDVRSYRDANCDSDHYLVKTTFTHKISMANKGGAVSTKRWNVELLINENKRGEYQQRVQEMLERREQRNDIEEE